MKSKSYATRLFLIAVIIIGPLALRSGQIEYTSCFLDDCKEIGGAEGVRFAYFHVPEDHTNPDGTYIRLAMAELKATGINSGLPIIHLTGGPGGKALSASMINRLSKHAFREHHDIYLVDFRGIGNSEPALCNGFQEALFHIFMKDLSPGEATSATITLYEECFQSLLDKGITLEQFNTATVVKDLELLRKLLHIPEWALWGISYGTRIAQTYMRDFPESVHTSILDSPVPMGYPFWGSEPESYKSALIQFFAACRNNPDCNQAFPNLEESFYAAYESLKKEPLTLTTAHSPTDRATINFQDMHLMTQQLLYNPVMYPVLPWFIKSVEMRDETFFKNLYPMLEQRHSSISSIIYMLVGFQDNGLVLDQVELKEHDKLYQALNYFDNTLKVMNRMDFISLDSIEALPVQTAIPSIILVGEMDPITTPVHAAVLDDVLENSLLYVFPGQGHAVTFNSACAVEVSRAFLINPLEVPDDGCINTMQVKPITWATSIYKNSRIALFADKLFNKRHWLILTTFGLLGLTFIISMVAWAATLFRKKKQKPVVYLRNLSARLTAFCAMALYGLLLYFINVTANSHGPLLIAGLIDQASMAMYMSFLVLAGAIWSLVSYIQSFMRSSAFMIFLYGLMNLSFVLSGLIIFEYMLFPF